MTALRDTSLISRSGNLLSTDLDGEVVLMSIERGNYYGMERTARRIWELLETPKTLAELCACLRREYAAQQDTLEADVRRFVARLVEEAVVTAT